MQNCGCLAKEQPVRKFKSELKKIVWPSWKQVLKGSAVVLVIVSLCAVAIGALDFAFSKGVTAIVELFV